MDDENDAIGLFQFGEEGVEENKKICYKMRCERMKKLGWHMV